MAAVLANFNKINKETSLSIKRNNKINKETTLAMKRNMKANKATKLAMKRKMETEEHKWRMLYLCIMRGLVGSFSLLIVSNLHQTTVLFRSLWKRNSEVHLITALHLVV